jgi:pimeloyl-ACP methyl ester carboxylesterase
MMWHVLGVLAAVYAGLSLTLFALQSSMVYYPEIGREMVASPRQEGLDYEDVKLVAADGAALQGWFVPCHQPRGTVLFLHGNAGNISHRLDSLLMFHRLGYRTLIIDYRGYGNSGGKP